MGPKNEVGIRYWSQVFPFIKFDLLLTYILNKTILYFLSTWSCKKKKKAKLYPPTSII